MANPHTARQLAPAIGATVTVRCEQLQVRCLVMDAKNSYGQVRILVMPVAGEGEDWRVVLEARMDQEQFWPNVWSLSDHGNLCLLRWEDDAK